MKPRKAIPFSFFLSLAVFFCLCRLASARSGKAKQTALPSSSTAELAVKWPPMDVDAFVPPVSSNPPCSTAQVLARAGRRIEQLVNNLDRFTATEIVDHRNVDRSGKLHVPEERRFDYLVSLSRRPSGFMNVNEYRRGRTREEEFPDHVATEGTPALVLIFHPKYAPDFSMTCEGLGEWHGQPAWQLRFEERDRSRAMIVMIIGGRAFNLRIRGRAWILADSYQVARLETDLAETIPPIHLRLDHQSVEYAPVRFPRSKVEIWLPASTELFMDFQGHRFYRRHTFTDFNLFLVKVDQQFGEVVDSEK
jgi:hypothetical protein